MTSKLTKRESEIMNYFWAHGAMFVKDLLALFPEPRPHVNTISTMVRSLEEKDTLVTRPMATPISITPPSARATTASSRWPVW